MGIMTDILMTQAFSWYMQANYVPCMSAKMQQAMESK